MQISFDDIQFAAELAYNEIANLALQKDLNSLKDEPLSIEKLQKVKSQYSPESIFATNNAVTLLVCAITSSIEVYHKQLRDKLLESGIDIGELDMSSSSYRDVYMNKFNEDDDE